MFTGKAYLWLKGLIFDPSNPIRHATKLLSLRKNAAYTSVEMMYTDGGIDHNISFLIVNIAWIMAYFVLSCCDTLIVGRTTPSQRWTNPGERVMSVFNTAMQSYASGRELMNEDFEKHMTRCKSMSYVRNLAKKLDRRRKKEIPYREGN